MNTVRDSTDRALNAVPNVLLYAGVNVVEDIEVILHFFGIGCFSSIGIKGRSIPYVAEFSSTY